CNLAFVVWEFQIHSATVYVKIIAQIFCAHCGTFQMPARKTIAPWRRPAHNMLWLGFFPKRKILRIFLVALCGKFAGVGNHIFEISAAEFSVMVGFVEF